MKIKINRLAAAGAAVLATAGIANAQDNLHGGRPYLNAAVGPNLQQDLSIHNVGEKVSFDPGTRLDVSAGYNIIDALAFEFQTGASENRIRTSGSHALSFGGQRAYLDQVPLMANLIFKAPLIANITPYIGGGAGGVVSTLTIRSNGHWTDDSDLTFGYQGMAGVNIALARHIDVGLGYRFVGTTAHTWFRDDPAMYTPAGKTLTHALEATFTFTF